MSDWLEELSKILRDSNVRITFSRNCCSGLVGTECQCWRCRKSRGEPVDEATEALAKKIAEAAQERMKLKLRRTEQGETE